MKIVLLGMLFALMIPPAKVPKFKYLDKSVPIYISIKKSPKDFEDAVSKFIKDSLLKAGFKINTAEEHEERFKQYFKDAQSNVKSFTKKDFENINDVFRKVYAGATPVQQISIIYVSGADSAETYESCDQIGFRHTWLPQNSPTPSFPVVMFKVKDIGSRMPDSMARFLLKKM